MIAISNRTATAPTARHEIGHLRVEWGWACANLVALTLEAGSTTVMLLLNYWQFNSTSPRLNKVFTIPRGLGKHFFELGAPVRKKTAGGVRPEKGPGKLHVSNNDCWSRVRGRLRHDEPRTEAVRGFLRGLSNPRGTWLNPALQVQPCRRVNALSPQWSSP